MDGSAPTVFPATRSRYAGAFMHSLDWAFFLFRRSACCIAILLSRFAGGWRSQTTGFHERRFAFVTCLHTPLHVHAFILSCCALEKRQCRWPQSWRLPES